MSGGSHNYLCHKDAEDLLHREEDLEHMVNSLKGYGTPDAVYAAAWTRTVLLKVQSIHKELAEVDKLLDKMSPIWRAVEWHHSGDSGEDGVHKATKELDL